MVGNENYFDMEGKLSITSAPSLKCGQDSSQCQTYLSNYSAASRFQTNAERGQIPSSHASSSFLCFLPKTDGRPNLIQSNEKRGNYFQGSFTGSSYSGVSRPKIQMNEIPNRTLGSVNATTAACLNVSHDNVETTMGNASNLQKISSEVGSSDVNFDCAENGGEQLRVTMKADAHRHESELSRDGKGNISHQIEHPSDISGHHGYTTETTEEEDEKAFEITQFFEAFKEGNGHLLKKLSGEAESVTERPSRQASETTSALEFSTSNLPTSEDQLILDRYRISKALRGEGTSDSTVLGHWNNVGSVNDAGRNGAIIRTRQSSRDDGHSFSRKWNEDVEAADSVSITFSGPLPLSGSVSYSGHSGQVLHSGSVSHRSDSSTASTHSFAFPVLPFEWNSSPVKMAQPDKRHNCQGWRGCLLGYFCCKKSTTVFD